MKRNGTTSAGTRRWRCKSCASPSCSSRSPTDDDIDGLFATASPKSNKDDGAPDEYGNGIVWGEFHMPTEYRQ